MKDPSETKLLPDTEEQFNKLRSVQAVDRVLDAPKKPQPGEHEEIPEYHNPYKGMKI